MADKIEPLNMKFFGLAEHMYATHSATANPGTTAKELTDPAYWAYVNTKLRMHDEIRVVAMDSSFYAKLLVSHIDGGNIYTTVVEWKDLNQPDINPVSSEQSKYEIKLKGPLKWCVVDKETGKNVREGIPDKTSAQRELEDYMRALAA